MDAPIAHHWMIVLGLALFGILGIHVFKTLPDMSGIFRDSSDAAKDSARTQAFVFFILSLIGYALSALAWQSEPNIPNVMPDVPSDLLAALGGSQALYLFKKYIRLQQ